MVLRSRTYRYRRSREHPHVQELKIDSIVQDAGLQVRQKIDESVVRRYASLYRTGVELPPIQVIKIGKEHVLADGWHRIGGSSKHEQFHHPNRPDTVISVPRHRTISTGVARSIAKTAAWSTRT